LAIEKCTIGLDKSNDTIKRTQIRFNDKKTPEEIPKDLDERVYDVWYNYYFGFTFKNNMNDDDYNKGETIFFSRKNYHSLDLSVFGTGKFGEIGNFTGGWRPPKHGDIICGIVKKDERGLFFSKWFTCSKQFFDLWRLIMYGPKHPSF